MKGLHSYRTRHNPDERRFQRAWDKINDDYHVFEYLLGDGNDSRVIATEREQQIVATVIQWLGSPVGMHFLDEATGKKR